MNNPPELSVLGHQTALCFSYLRRRPLPNRGRQKIDSGELLLQWERRYVWVYNEGTLQIIPWLLFILKGLSVAVEISHGVLNFWRSLENTGFWFQCFFVSCPIAKIIFIICPGDCTVSSTLVVCTAHFEIHLFFFLKLKLFQVIIPSLQIFIFQKWPTHYWIIKFDNRSFSDNMQWAANIALGLNQETTGWCYEGVSYPNRIIYP